MKQSPFRIPLVGLALFLVAGSVQTRAQEEDLNRAIADQERRTSGLNALASNLRNMIADWLPAGMVSTPEETAQTPEPAEKVEVKEVKLAETAATDSSTLAQQEAEQQRLYREALQTAVTKLEIRGTFPRRKQILIGAKNLNVGDKIDIEFRQKRFHLEILDITAEELKMRDTDSQIQVSLAIGLTHALPPGMSRERPPGTFGMSSDPAPGSPEPTPAKP
ncbi:MAG: hypothetical protein JNK37_16265 [Verrucomicrobiales bacterium]|nr:hypothetical protein [Verrucomicrobiales bacterium]